MEIKHGLTAQYWLGYIKMLHLYHKLSRSIWTGDLDLYILCLPKITNHFFVFNHHNYARWFVLFHDNLLKLKITHTETYIELNTETYIELKNGFFSLKRTTKPFLRFPVDLTLEQTINMDVTGQRFGKSSLFFILLAKDGQKVVI